ncbi:MAG: DMT family transporter [Acidobacteriota bacterium]|nr:DMT family transporter [Acidobacteriota bacterium]
MTARPPHRLIPYLQIVGAAFLFSTGGAAIKASTLTAWQISSFRSGIAVIALLALIPAARRRVAWTRPALIGGAALGATFVLYVHANTLTTAADAIFLQGTAPLYVAVLGTLFLGEKPHAREIAFMGALAVGGAAFFVGLPQPLATAPDPATGNLLGTLSGLTWALTILGLRWVQRGGTGRASAAVVAISGNFMACLVGLPAALPVVGATALDWGLVGFLGVFQIGVAYVLLTKAVQRLTALEVSLFVLIEPVLNAVWAWWIHGEALSGWAVGGGALILTAAAVRALTQGRTPTRTTA